MDKPIKLLWAAFAIALLAPAIVSAGVEITIVNGAGFDDATPRAPVGGNSGETVGEQRRIAFDYVAALLGSKLDSDVEIRVAADFVSLECGGFGAVLGQAGPASSLTNFPGAPQADVFYPIALANTLAGSDQAPPGNAQGVPETDIRSEFNADIDDDPECLAGLTWYYGLDGDSPPTSVDFIATAVHELIHGLGYFSGVNLNTGEFAGSGLPFVYDSRIVDLNMGAWPQLSDNERMASIVNDPLVVFDGPLSNGDGAASLSDGTNGSSIRLFAPNDGPVPGSSISHWDTSVTPDALMEPRDTNNVNVNDGIGLAACVLADLGWQLASGTSCPDRQQFDPSDFEADQDDPDSDPDTGAPPDGDGGSGDSDGDAGGGGAAVGSDTSGNGGDNDGAGGGCTLAGPAAAPAPLLPLLIAAAFLGLYRRRLRPARASRQRFY